jgi:hypothetical protein
MALATGERVPGWPSSKSEPASIVRTFDLSDWRRFAPNTKCVAILRAELDGRISEVWQSAV